MTISDALIQWLAGFEGLEIDSGITTDMLDARAEAYGLYKTPQTTVNTYIDGTRDITAYYRFLARQRGQLERERQNGQAVLEQFETWVANQNRMRMLPTLGNGCDCQSVEVANTFNAEYQESSEVVYELTLAVSYIEARKE